MSAVVNKHGRSGKAAYRDQDDQCEGVEVIDDVVGYTVSHHGGSLGGHVVVQLVVCDP